MTMVDFRAVQEPRVSDRGCSSVRWVFTEQTEALPVQQHESVRTNDGCCAQAKLPRRPRRKVTAGRFFAAPLPVQTSSICTLGFNHIC